MNNKFSIKLINKIKNPHSANRFVSGFFITLMLILSPLLLLLVMLFLLILFLISMFQRLTSTKEQRQAAKSSELINKSIDHQWTIFAETNGATLYQQISGIVCNGPDYLNLKSDPHIETLTGKLFGNWFFSYQNGIFLQQWNSIKKPDTNLIFLNTENLELKVILQNIPTVFWNMVETENKSLELVCDSGNEILIYKIETNKKLP
jgi:hypothetical protein